MGDAETFESLLARLKADPDNARLYAGRLYDLGWEQGRAVLATERPPRADCLSAAASDLLAVLKAIVAEIRAYQSPECDDDGAPGAAELKLADAAIAKAEGRGS